MQLHLAWLIQSKLLIQNPNISRNYFNIQSLNMKKIRQLENFQNENNTQHKKREMEPAVVTGESSSLYIMRQPLLEKERQSFCGIPTLPYHLYSKDFTVIIAKSIGEKDEAKSVLIAPAQAYNQVETKRLAGKIERE